MKETVLVPNHKELGASFAEFGGYNMPLWYKSAKEEHLNVIKNVGLFDTSHMALFTLEGADTTNLLNSAFSRDITELKSGRAVYGLFRTKDNHVIDDAVLYKREEFIYFIVVNAGMSETVIDHLKTFNFTNVTITNYMDKLGKIDVQGPKSLELMERIFGQELFDKFPYFSFKGFFSNGEILISRSGYTGEFGFELYVEKEKAPKLWEKLLKTGEDLGIKPCGLASRDSLRVGAGLPLSHQDIGDWEFVNTPWDFAVSEITKSSLEYTYPYVGFDVRKLRGGTGDVLLEDDVIGKVLSCVTEVSITRIDNKILSISSKDLPADVKVKGLVAGFFKVDKQLEVNQIVKLTDGKRELKVEIVNSIRPDRTARKAIKNIRSIR